MQKDEREMVLVKAKYKTLLKGLLWWGSDRSVTDHTCEFTHFTRCYKNGSDASWSKRVSDPVNIICAALQENYSKFQNMKSKTDICEVSVESISRKRKQPQTKHFPRGHSHDFTTNTYFC